MAYTKEEQRRRQRCRCPAIPYIYHEPNYISIEFGLQSHTACDGRTNACPWLISAALACLSHGRTSARRRSSRRRRRQSRGSSVIFGGACERPTLTSRTTIPAAPAHEVDATATESIPSSQGYQQERWRPRRRSSSDDEAPHLLQRYRIYIFTMNLTMSIEFGLHTACDGRTNVRPWLISGALGWSSQ
jgi:hypothetical protein